MTSQLLNSVDDCVDECLAGLVAAHPSLAQLTGQRVVLVRDLAARRQRGARVALLSGGGSGHEPAHAGFVGAGMLTAAVAGDVFASPPTSAIVAAVRAVSAPAGGDGAGVLMVLMNYTGDRMQFGLAAERCKAQGLAVEVVVVGEDTALSGRDRSAGRRGLAGGQLVNKIAGAAAEQGLSLAQVAAVARQVSQQIATISVSLSACTKPGQGKSFQLAEGEMELGLGIHGEAGVQRLKARSSRETVKLMLDHMTGAGATAGNTGDTHSSSTKFTPAERVALLVNSLGGLSMLEMGVITHDVISELRQRGVRVARVISGTLMSSLDMHGVSVSLLNLPAAADTAAVADSDQLLRWLDAPTEAPAWPRAAAVDCDVTLAPIPIAAVGGDADHTSPEEGAAGATLDAAGARRLSRCLEFATEALVSCEAQLNSLDTGAGDGDCGSTLAGLSRAVAAAYLPARRPRAVLSALGAVCETVGGTSGAIYSIAFTAAAAALPADRAPTVADWVSALSAGLQAVEHYGAARPGDRTLLDAVAPALRAAQGALRAGATGAQVALAAAEAAEAGALSTVAMAAHAGRASYVSAELLTRPDPGAHAVGVWMRAVAEALKLHA